MPSDRYSRQTLIPEWDQAKINDATVLILGVGATGSYVATNLALSGVGKLVLVDFDTIERSNLNRQLLFRDDDIKQNKAEVAKIRLEKLNPKIEILAFPNRMEELPKSIREEADIIACCLDTFRGRRWANSLALNEEIPMVNGGMYAFMGDIQTIIPNQTACFECQPLVSQEKLAQACTPLGEARQELGEIKEEVTLPSVSTLSSIISGLMSQEIIKLILDVGNVLDNYLFYDGLHNSFTQLKLEKNNKCPICGTGNKLESQQAIVFPNETVKDFKKRVALAFGMADPRLMIKGKFLQEDDKMECKNGDKIYALDERLAAPIMIIAKTKED